MDLVRTVWGTVVLSLVVTGAIQQNSGFRNVQYTWLHLQAMKSQPRFYNPQLVAGVKITSWGFVVRFVTLIHNSMMVPSQMVWTMYYDIVAWVSSLCRWYNPDLSGRFGLSKTTTEDTSLDDNPSFSIDGLCISVMVDVDAKIWVTGEEIAWNMPVQYFTLRWWTSSMRLCCSCRRAL